MGLIYTTCAYCKEAQPPWAIRTLYDTPVCTDKEACQLRAYQRYPDLVSHPDETASTELPFEISRR